MNVKTKRILADIMLLFVGAIWGGGFVVMKNALDSIPVNFLLAIRFTIGALGLSFTLIKHKPNRSDIAAGAVVGALIYSAFAVQTYGLMFTTAGNNALITAFYVVLVPLFGWLIYKRRPENRTLYAAGLMLAGIALLSLQSGFTINIGDALTLLCGVLYALHILKVDEYTKKHDVMQLTCLQFTFAALYAWVAGACCETFPTQFTPSMLGDLAYCGIAATLIALTLMNVGIRYASPEYASLFMSTESAFGCIFGVIFLHEAFNGRILAGCVLIMLALVLSQVNFGKREKHAQREL